MTNQNELLEARRLERALSYQRKPLAIDLFCGLGGWSDGLLAEGWDVVGFDIERHRYPGKPRFDVDTDTGEPIIVDGLWQQYPGQLVLQDVLTLHGSQFKDCSLIVCSPPCQEFSYMSMPWKRAKQIAAALRGDADESGLVVDFPEGYTGSRTIAELTALFDACFRIQREASEAAGRHIPMVVENVKGAQPWVGRAKANYGSFYLWGDVESIGGRVVASPRLQFGTPSTRAYRFRKVPMNFHEHEKTGKPGRSFQSAAVESEGVSSKSSARKAASAAIAKIPFSLANYIARCFKPDAQERVA